MQDQRIEGSALRVSDPRRDVMKQPDEVAAMLRLKALGWGMKRIGREFGVSHRELLSDHGLAPSRFNAFLESWLFGSFATARR